MGLRSLNFANCLRRFLYTLEVRAVQICWGSASSHCRGVKVPGPYLTYSPVSAPVASLLLPVLQYSSSHCRGIKVPGSHLTYSPVSAPVASLLLPILQYSSSHCRGVKVPGSRLTYSPVSAPVASLTSGPAVLRPAVAALSHLRCHRVCCRRSPLSWEFYHLLSHCPLHEAFLE